MENSRIRRIVGDFVLNCPRGELDVDVAIPLPSSFLTSTHSVPLGFADKSLYAVALSFASECWCSSLRFKERERGWGDGFHVRC
jgi:hypothetical protein